MGGISSEREISLKTGEAVSRALKASGREVHDFDVTRDLAARLDQSCVEAVFICLHGKYGEDGSVQGLLELLKLPYTGSGILASAAAMDKSVSKALFNAAGVITPDSITFTGFPTDEEMARIKLPSVIKPCREGSTVGISIASEPGELREAFSQAFDYDGLVMAEDYIKGRELTVAVFDEPVKSLPVVEVIAERGFYDYNAKYVTGETKYIVPAELSGAEEQSVVEESFKAYRALGCAGLARVDFLLKDGKPYCLEVNTIPGMTESSLVPKAASAAGIPFVELIDSVMESARVFL